MRKYSIITPVKNERNYIEKTIDSVINQIILPVEWIIVDDESNDGTEMILNKVAEEYHWIKIIKPETNQIKDYSSRVVHLFNYGYKQLTEKVDYISKLDGDVSFNSDFYKNILIVFEKNPILGIASGHLTIDNIPEEIIKTPYTCTRGATKVYRIKCLEDIGGIISFQGWDTLDNVAARAKGWQVEIVPEYFEHLKEEGSKVGNKFYSNFRTGYYNGSVPYLLSYFILKALSKFFTKPYFVGSMFQIFGYVKGRFFSKKRPFANYIVNQLHKEQKDTLRKMQLLGRVVP